MADRHSWPGWHSRCNSEATKISMLELNDESLLKPDAAFINGEWRPGSATFEVFGKVDHSFLPSNSH